MPRENKSEAEILEWINAEIHRNDEYEDVEVTSIQKSEEDEEGSNWSQWNIEGHGVLVEVYADRVNYIAEQARELFNIK